MSACVPTRADEPRREKHIHEPHSPPPTRPRLPRIAGADVSASIAVFLIALPLSLGIALATGAPLQAGLVAAAVGGLVAGRLGGAPLQVSGPAAGLTVVTAELIQRYGWRTTCAITVLAGLAQLGLGLLRVARGALAVSPAIVHGMLAGIGVTIAVAQLHIVLGGTPHSSVPDNLRELPGQLARVHPAALSVSVLTLAMLVVWPRLPGRVGRWLRKVPTPLVAVAVATTTASLAGLHLPKVDLPSWSSHALASLPEGPALGLVAAVLTITLVCSVQSLLGAVAVDKLVAGRPEQAARVGRSDLDRELLGQGAANVVSGALGGLPIAGVAVRSSANVHAGAVSRNSTMLHGVLVVVAALLMVPILELIPLASLAALVMAVGIQMVSLHHIRTVTRHREALVYAVTTLGVVFLGVLEGVALGIAMAVGVALHRLTRTRITHDEKEGVHHVHVRGQLTFLAVPRLSRALHLVPQGAHAVVELDGSFMDHAAYESLQDWQNTHTAHGGSVELVGRRAGVRIGEPTGPAGLHADAGRSTAGSADCRCHPWTPWRNHQCEIPETAAPPRDGRPGEARANGIDETPGSGTPSGTDAPNGPTGTDKLDTTGESGAPGAADGTVESGRAEDNPADAGGGGGADDSRPSARQLARGISAFQRNTAPLVRSELARLAREGQRPSQLFLTCADSRLVTSMITSSGPGDLFVVRNVGNLVPPPADAGGCPQPGQESGDDSVAAAIEYAVDVLQVRSITVCGHSGCGAMQALLASEPDGPQTPLRRWLRHGRPSLERLSDESRPWPRLAGRAPADAVEQLCLTNVVQQLEHLRTHESVARALRAGALELHGMYFHVGEAQAYLLAEGREDEVFDHVGVADLSA
ncbi:bifunctional SulP family inorganic anion transporter/carbonic anhydrase [Streptomyces ferrugineus]|uniref:Bifunctional SulP family inorganic anion transporter/carbonic anhydrase n=1 Tax=Streptomyces ferrugineus TaxID=1413221 RepID=A0A7M2SK38_9ACTN|nr:SulP family inorganic anion transporter [Streptomyces ferrugineus]QOV36632.1 bifunctional SulP family inorganic anion transporter/carbonic anhydrase [Streptomyces ferrugineus]